MKNIHELLAGKHVGLVTAHPDDHLINAHAVWSAHAAGATVREITATKGRRSTVNHLPQATFVADGYREQEGRRAADYMGIASNDHLDGPDGNLAGMQAELAPIIGQWASHHGIQIFITLGGLTDHPDHIASAAIARLAAIELWDTTSYPVGILEIQQADTGTWQARAHTESQATAYGAARMHASQMMIAEAAEPGWEAVPGGLWVHPDTMAGLDQYPIRRSATYHWTPPGMAGQDITIEQPANRR